MKGPERPSSRRFPPGRICRAPIRISTGRNQVRVRVTEGEFYLWYFQADLLGCVVEFWISGTSHFDGYRRSLHTAIPFTYLTHQSESESDFGVSLSLSFSEGDDEHKVRYRTLPEEGGGTKDTSPNPIG